MVLTRALSSPVTRFIAQGTQEQVALVSSIAMSTRAPHRDHAKNMQSK